MILKEGDRKKEQYLAASPVSPSCPGQVSKFHCHGEQLVLVVLVLICSLCETVELELIHLQDQTLEK